MWTPGCVVTNNWICCWILSQLFLEISLLNSRRVLQIHIMFLNMHIHKIKIRILIFPGTRYACKGCKIRYLHCLHWFALVRSGVSGLLVPWSQFTVTWLLTLFLLANVATAQPVTPLTTSHNNITAIKWQGDVRCYQPWGGLSCYKTLPFISAISVWTLKWTGKIFRT